MNIFQLENLVTYMLPRSENSTSCSRAATEAHYRLAKGSRLLPGGISSLARTRAKQKCAEHLVLLILRCLVPLIPRYLVPSAVLELTGAVGCVELGADRFDYVFFVYYSVAEAKSNPL